MAGNQFETSEFITGEGVSVKGLCALEEVN